MNMAKDTQEYNSTIIVLASAKKYPGAKK